MHVMTDYSVISVEQKRYAIYFSIYTSDNILDSFDWNDALESITGDRYLFVVENKSISGGFVLTGNQLCYPFVSPTFDRTLFWKRAIAYASDSCSDNDIIFKYIPDSDASILVNVYYFKVLYAQRRMLRPTELTVTKLSEKFYFTELADADKDEIIKVVYEAHSTGYTAAVNTPNIDAIGDAINRRYYLFSKTNSLHFSNLVKYVGSNEIAGVCIAGIYPDSPNNFSTIHQVSVRPMYRRQGAAEAMILNSVNRAFAMSPAITLGVMVGNPAELLYEKIGFRKGSKYSELRLAAESKTKMR